MSARRCGTCGAEVRVVSEPCPLCGGTSVARPAVRRKRAEDVERYQRDVRALREQLRRLREGAEAV